MMRRAQKGIPNTLPQLLVFPPTRNAVINRRARYVRLRHARGSTELAAAVGVDKVQDPPGKHLDLALTIARLCVLV
jgi:hypothetical protein